MSNYSTFKLLPNWKNPIFHGKTIRSSVTQNLWSKKIRKHMLETYDYTCATCGYKSTPENARYSIHVHEVEEYDLDNLVCHLKKLELICAKCHGILHFKRSLLVFNEEQVLELEKHFMRVNDCTREDLKKCYKIRLEQDRGLLKKTLANEEVGNPMTNRKITFTVNEDVPFYDEIITRLKKKELLYEM